MKRQINSAKRVVSQTAKVSTVGLRNAVSKIKHTGCETISNTASTVKSQIGRAGGIVKDKLPDLNPKQLERMVPTTVVGSLNAAVPCVLKDLPEVAKSLANRAGNIASDKLFELIPDGVKLSEKHIVEFITKHEVSHIKSIKNNPAKAGDVNNVVFEISSKNRARGSRNMSRAEVQSARFNNTITGIKSGLKTTVSTAAKGALFGALLELPITTVENILHVKNTRKSVGDARIDAAKDIGISAGLAGVTAAGFTGLSLLGVTVTLGPAVIPLTIIGGAVYTWSATDRIWKALDDTTRKKLMNSNPVSFLTSTVYREHPDLDKIKSEQSEAAADLITTREQEEIADMLSGISMDGTSAELTRMREIREKAKARSKVAQELAGINPKSEEEEFLTTARSINPYSNNIKALF